MRTLQCWLDRTATVTAGGLVAVFMAVMVYNVFSRYFFGGGISWYMESSQFLNIWAVFVGGVGLCASNDHLRVSVLDSVLKGKPALAGRVLVALLTAAFYCLLCYASCLLAWRTRQSVSTMPTVKMAWIYWPVPVAAALSALAVVVNFVNSLSGNGANGGRRDDSVPAD